MPRLELPDCKLFYKLDDHTDPWTRPDTVLFVHGFTECTEAWRAWVPHFSRRYRMVRIDQRGFGQSEAVAKDFPLTTELFVDDLIGTDTKRRGKAVFDSRQKTIPNSELVMFPIDGYHAAGTDPDGTARVTLDFIARHS